MRRAQATVLKSFVVKLGRVRLFLVCDPRKLVNVCKSPFFSFPALGGAIPAT